MLETEILKRSLVLVRIYMYYTYICICMYELLSLLVVLGNHSFKLFISSRRLYLDTIAVQSSTTNHLTVQDWLYLDK